MSSSCGGIETGEIHNSTPPEQGVPGSLSACAAVAELGCFGTEEEVASLDRSAERLKIDPFGAVKPLEKQKRLLLWLGCTFLSPVCVAAVEMISVGSLLIVQTQR